MEFRLGMDGWENGVRHRHTGREVERINKLDPVSSGTEVEKANKYNTNTLHRHTKFMCTGYEESLSTEFRGLYFTCMLLCNILFTIYQQQND